MPLTQDQFDEDIARLHNNMNEAEGRAADWRAKGREDRAQVWDASAARYSKLIDAKIKIFESSKRIAEIQERLKTPPPPPPVVPGTPVAPSPFVKPKPSGDSDGNAGGNSGGSRAPAPAPAPTPPTPATPPPPPPPPPIKTAPIDTIVFNEDYVDQNLIADLLFENVGGQEILSIARYDTVNGQEVSYQPIKNLNIIQQEYNPNNLLRIQKTSDKTFANFPIKLTNKIPNVGNGPNGSNIYLNDNGAIVIEFVNILDDEQVEIQIASSGTIYEVDV